MNLPGFTAETSLRSASGTYRSMAGHSFGSTSQVLPQLPIGFCQANCDRIQDPFLRTVCELQCFSQGGGGGTGGGGGGGQVCRPQCGRCLPDSDSPTGRSKLCILRNCNDVTRSC